MPSCPPRSCHRAPRGGGGFEVHTTASPRLRSHRPLTLFRDYSACCANSDGACATVRPTRPSLKSVRYRINPPSPPALPHSLPHARSVLAACSAIGAQHSRLWCFMCCPCRLFPAGSSWGSLTLFRAHRVRHTHSHAPFCARSRVAQCHRVSCANVSCASLLPSLPRCGAPSTRSVPDAMPRGRACRVWMNLLERRH